MFRTKKCKTFFKDNIKKLMKKEKNDKLKSLIENEETFPTFSDSTGTTLLHMAAKCNNIEMARYLIDSGCEIDAIDPTGTTALIIAVKLNHFYIVKILLDANADIFVTNFAEEYPLRLIFVRKRGVIYQDILKICYEIVQSKCSNFEEVMETLLKAGCSLHTAIFLQDTNVTRAILDKVKKFDILISMRCVKYSIHMNDISNLEVLLTCGSQVNERIEFFLWYLSNMTNKETLMGTLDTLRELIKKTIDWKLLNENNIDYITPIFEDADEDVVRVLLESDIVSHVKSHLDYSLLKHLYGNQHTGVIEMLQSMHYDSEACANPVDGNSTALHIAINRFIPKNVKLLLDLGADPNIADECGKTPLLWINKFIISEKSVFCLIECIKLLLKSNADVEVRDNKGKNFIEYLLLDDDNHLALLQPVLAHIAMLEATAAAVKPSTLEYIYAHDELKSRYDTCKRQLEDMKMSTVTKSFNLMMVLISKPEKVARFVGSQIGIIISTLKESNSWSELNDYYLSVLKDRLNRALKVYKLRSKLTDLIVDNIPTFKGFTVVIDQIIDNFSFQDLLSFA